MDFRMCWPTRDGYILQRFGENPAFYRKFGLPGHEGLDFAASYRSGIYAVADGFVGDVRLDAFSDPLVKPYGNQVRIQHPGGYETVYAHLSQVIVVRGQLVGTGQLIGMAGSTGYTSGPHLHLSLKKRGASADGETVFPYDLIDPEPFLLEFADCELGSVDPPESALRVQVAPFLDDDLNIWALPHTGSEIVTIVSRGIWLVALEDAAVVTLKVGREGQWLWVCSPDGQVGWVAAWLVTLPDDVAPPSEPVKAIFVIVNTPGENLIMREGPGTAYAERMRFADGTVLKALEPEAIVKERVGLVDAWLHVQAPGGEVGYCAALYLKLPPFNGKPVIPEPPVAEPTSYVVVNSPELGLRLRAGPDTTYDRIWWMPHKTILESLEDPAVTASKLHQQETWIHVRTPSLVEGYAAAWYLQRPEQADVREPATSTMVPTGINPSIFGIHALAVADDPYSRDGIQELYTGTGKQGWVLFTEICGRHAHTMFLNPPIRAWLWEWAAAGYGVIVRLNHGYEPGGTLPESQYYTDFAEAAARWVELNLADAERSPLDFAWTIQIGNEQNNPREHPGGFESPIEHITPELYAEAFNQTYLEIKRVLPNAIVCPGAVDPYNYMPMRMLGDARWRPVDYFTAMLANIQALDGIILHAYTHGPDPSLITHLKRFGQGTGPLWDHYYDFQAYRVFMERIPEKWRDLPVYLTEMNHIHRPAGEHDQGWINQNIGWVQAAYAEIHRWNQSPHHQQIHCGLLYRWMGDAWSIKDKPGILEDFQQALANDYRWRTYPAHAASAAPAALQIPRSAPEELEERFLVQPDDLTRLWGIGEKTQAVLYAAGLLTFEQLAWLDPDQVAVLVGETGLRAEALSTWPEQARLATAGRWEAVLAYRDSDGSTIAGA